VALKAARHVEGLLTVDEARRWLAVSRSTLYLLMREGRLRFVRVGRSCRIEVEALREFLGEQWVEPTGRLTHGRRYAYQVGCRCDACRTAWNDYHRTARKRRSANLEQVSNGLKHGTVSTYKNHGCRCDACARAGSKANKRRPSRTVRPDRRLIS
jgi:excisionase family DNA binding protein